MNLLDLMMVDNTGHQKEQQEITYGKEEKVTIQPIKPEDMPSFSIEVGVDDAALENEEHKEKPVVKKNEKEEKITDEEIEKKELEQRIYDEPVKVSGYNTGIERMKEQFKILQEGVLGWARKKSLKKANNAVEDAKNALASAQAEKEKADTDLSVDEKEKAKKEKAVEAAQKVLQTEEENRKKFIVATGVNTEMALKVGEFFLKHMEDIAKNSSEYDAQLLWEHKNLITLINKIINEVKNQVFASQKGKLSVYDNVSSMSYAELKKTAATNITPVKTELLDGMTAMMGMAAVSDEDMKAFCDRYIYEDDFQEVMEIRQKRLKSLEKKKTSSKSKPTKKRKEKKKKESVSKAQDKKETQLSIMELMGC